MGRELAGIRPRQIQFPMALLHQLSLAGYRPNCPVNWTASL